MSENPRFDIIFNGKITTDFPMAIVQQKVAALFKLDASRVEQLFTNGQVALKQNLDATTAEKYRHVLTKAGMVVVVKPQVAAVVAPAVSPVAAGAPDWGVAEVGVRLSEPATPEASVPLNSSISVAPQEGNLLRPEEVVETVAAVNLAEIDDWDLGPVGNDLLHAEEKASREQTAKEQALVVDVEHLSVSENKGDLLRDNEKSPFITSDIDTRNIQLADQD